MLYNLDSNSFGLPGRNTINSSQSGKVILFKKASGVWTEFQEILSPMPATGFGPSVDIEDGFLVISELGSNSSHFAYSVGTWYRAGPVMCMK